MLVFVAVPIVPDSALCGSCDYSKTYARSRYYDEAKPWNERCDVAFAGASQNEIDHSDAIIGSNMPFTPEGVQILRKASVLIAPSMAAGAGGMRLWLENLN
ncbi:hypothetical protein JHK86_045900 [Glycine max]|nr:hypothetical protein JHK86_045900 [Glycine max]